ncbi:MAG: sulfatase-like hydrolase/transferase [Bacteroidota bacterium]
MRKKLIRGSAWTLGILALPMAWLLWPIPTDDFPMTWDADQEKAKTEFLAGVVDTPDSLTRPNIILIVADDLGKTDISLYGSELIETPHMDAIGQNGATFTEGYVTSPVCSPSRASLLTGRYQQRFGYHFQLHEIYLKNQLQYLGFKYLVDSAPWAPVPAETAPRQADLEEYGLPPSELTISELLKKYEYNTALIGKWHVGHSDFALPCNRGFDYQYGFYNSHSLFAPEGSEGVVDQHVPEDFTDDHIWGSQRDGISAIFRDCEEIEEPEYLTDRIAEESIAFMEANADEPFFLYVPFSAPHTPFQAKQEDYDKFAHIEDPYKRIYLAMIQNLDDAVGSIMNKVTELGIEENTLVIFISDNGGATYTLACDNAPLKGGKITQFEGGINVPYMMQWKGVIEPGIQYADPVASIDIFSTIAGAIQAELPTDRAIDGVNLIPYLRKEKVGQPHESLYWKTGRNMAIRKGDWKMLHNTVSERTVLYNLKADKNETTDLSQKMPEKVIELMNAHKDWAAQLPAPIWPGVVTYAFDDGEEVFLFDN